jgi:dolichyl-phosphate beta-glucosyltransferase
MKLSIVIPAYNEEKRIPSTLAQLARFLRKESNLKDSEVEVLVVVNNSTDETYNIVRIFQKHFKFIKAYNIPHAIGKGGAIKFGFSKAKGDYIAFMDADGASPGFELINIYKKLVKSGADIAIADRYSKESTIIGKIPAYRQFYSRSFRTLYKLFFGLRYNDTQCGLKVFTKSAGKYLMANNDVNGWTFDLNVLLMAQLLDLNVLSVPTVWEYKDDSTLNTKKAFKTVPVELLKSFKKYKLSSRNVLSREEMVLEG